MPTQPSERDTPDDTVGDTNPPPENPSPTSPTMSLLDRLITAIQHAGTVGEENTERDGAFSHKAETHASAMGLAAGWFATAQGDTQLLSLVYGAAIYGRTFGETGQRKRILVDIKDEWHYALGGIVIGATAGSLTSGAVHGIDIIGDIPLPL